MGRTVTNPTERDQYFREAGSCKRSAPGRASSSGLAITDRQANECEGCVLRRTAVRCGCDAGRDRGEFPECLAAEGITGPERRTWSIPVPGKLADEERTTFGTGFDRTQQKAVYLLKSMVHRPECQGDLTRPERSDRTCWIRHMRWARPKQDVPHRRQALHDVRGGLARHGLPTLFR
jgi:hypothetical protein